MTKALFVGRVRLVTALFALLSMVIVGRLYLLQVVRADMYITRADAQFAPPASPLLLRDNIYFTDKNGTLITAATLTQGFTLAINPSKVADGESLYLALSPLVAELSHDDFIARATKEGSLYQMVVERLDVQTAEIIQKLSLPGVILSKNQWRFYPGGSLAAQELGFVAYNDGNVLEGRYGLERYFEQTLARQDKDLYTNFFVQLFGAAQAVFNGAPQTGDLLTTIEPSVQAELERALVAYADNWHPRLAGGIIMDPQTGDIYAMAINPTFDLNAFGAQKDPFIFKNAMVEDVFEMGSIMKPLTLAAGIDAGVITPESTYKDTGCITVDTKKICNYDLRARGEVPMQEILSQSLNLGASYVATEMGPAVMRDYFLNRYKFGEETGIDLPSEARGLVDNIAKSSRQVEFDTASFGQGIAVTPIAMVQALAALANGGKLVPPHFVRAVRYDSGITRTLSWAGSSQALLPGSALAVSRMLTKVVDTALVDGKIKIERHSVAAKTGTAQIANPGGGGYYTDRFLHSFFGYFPSYDARFIVFLFALEPQGASYSSQTWALPFHSLTQFLISYYDIPPDR
ncbi:penicillin-binding protein 2 [Patescibacteria group bacterium]|nr:penicillin-binding protein 2 [Patescibacteria group bacterium]